jgi:hypothetical protein
MKSIEICAPCITQLHLRFIFLGLETVHEPQDEIRVFLAIKQKVVQKNVERCFVIL